MPTKIYRIIHRDNLEAILRDGLLRSPNSGKDTDYISIGETELVKHRSSMQISIPPGGTINDYIAFYFGVRSPMLYCIKKGFQAVRRPQTEIIYLESSIEKLQRLNAQFVFTDGHAYAAFTQFFNDVINLGELDWQAINARKWDITLDDPDRKRRKQAECFVFQELSIEAIEKIAVYNQEAYDYITDVLHRTEKEIPVSIQPTWYY